MNSSKLYLRLTRLLIFCLAAFYGGRSLAALSTDEKIAVLEKKQDELGKQISDLDAMLEKRWQLLPMAKLWVTSDHVVYRTAVPEFYTEKLTWVIIRDGVEILQKRAGNEVSLAMFSDSRAQPGSYVIYLSTWIDGTYRPVSNVLAFQLAAKPDQPAPLQARPVPQSVPSASPSPPMREGSSIDSKLKNLDRQIGIAAGRVTEYLAYREQQRTLPIALTLWMDQNHVIYRNVGSEETEEYLQWAIRGDGTLGRNAREETSFRPWYTKEGRYTACLTSGNTAISNTLEFGPAPKADFGNSDGDTENVDPGASDDDMDHDGLTNSKEAVYFQ